MSKIINRTVLTSQPCRLPCFPHLSPSFMGKDQFERLLRFARRTGDRLIVTDPAGEEPIVVMSLDQYESLVQNALGPSKGFRLPEPDEADVPDFIPALEVMDEVPTVELPPVRQEPVRRAVAPNQKIQEKPQEPGEEQFYLEPL